MKPQIKRTIRMIAVALVVILAAVLVISAVERKETDKVRSVGIQIKTLENGFSLIDSVDVMATIERSFGFKLESQQLGLVNINRVERVLKNEPFVLDAEVFLDARDNVKISLEQREPILRIIDKDGNNFYLDREGQKMPLSKHYTARVLVATGAIEPHAPNYLIRKNHNLKDLYYLTQYILSNEFWNSMIEQVYVKDGGFVLIPKVGKQKIQFGKFEKVESKFKRLKAFYDEGMSRKGWNKYRTIDVRFDGQVIGRK